MAEPDKVKGEWKDSPPPKGWEESAPPPAVTAENLPGATPQGLESARMAPATMTQPSQFEKDRPGKGISTEGMLPAMLDAAKGIVPGFLREQLDPREFAHPERWPITRMAIEAKKGWQRPSDVRAKIGESVLSGLGALVGESAESAAQHGERGEGGAIMGEAAIPAAMAIGGYALPKIAGSMRPALQRMAYKELPTSGAPQLTRAARSTAALVGAGGGALAGGVTPVPGGAYVGGHTGLLVGPTIMERMIGTPELGSIRNPGPFSKIPLRAPKMLTAPEVRSSPFEGMTSSAKPSGAGELPPVATKMGEPQAPVKMVSKFEKPAAAEPSKIIKPGSTEAKSLRVEGSYWSFKEPALRKAVMAGDRDAAVVYKQRFGELPEGAGLLTDVAQGPTKGLYRSRN